MASSLLAGASGSYRHQASPFAGGGGVSLASSPSSSYSLIAKQSQVRPVQFRSANVASTQSANIRWTSAQEAVNFMEHLYYLTNLVLDYLLENELPNELMNQTLLNDPVSVLVEHRNELIKHFHKLLIAACTCLCIGISIPLFGFMIACCWCSSGSRGSSTKRSSRGHSSSRASSGGRHSRSRGHHRESSDADWLALSARDSSHLDRSGHQRPGGSRHQQDRRYRHSRHHRRSASNGGAATPGSGHYRSRSVPPTLRFETGCHSCLRTFFSSNLFVILLLISFFAVCAFVTNEYVDNGVKQLPRALNSSMDEVQSYLNNTEHEVDNLFRVNYKQLENEINLRLDTSGAIMKHKLAIASEAIALANLTDIVMEFDDTKNRLERLDRELTILKSRLNTAKRGLGDFRTKIENCPSDQCSVLKRKYRDLESFRIYSHYERLPDVKQLIKKVSQLLESGIVEQVQQGKSEFDRFGTLIQREVNGTAPEIKMQLSVVGRRLSGVANDISQSIRWSDYLFNHTRSSTKKLNQYSEYEQYRRYACLGGAAVISFILICYTFGWLFGSCRPQPTARTFKTRVKTSASASFPFSCGIFTVFLLFLPMILAAIVLFMTGSIGDKIVCRVIKHPEQKQSKQIYAMFQNKLLGSNLSVSQVDQDKVSFEKIDGKELKVYRPNYADLITRCHQNQSIYKVLKLDQYDKVYLIDDGRNRKISIGSDRGFDSNSSPELKRIANIDGKLRDLVSRVKVDGLRVTLLSEQAENTLHNSAGLSFDDIENSFARLYDNGVSISPIDIEQLIKDFQTQKASVTNSDVESDLTLATIMATSFQEQLLPNITSSLLNLKEGVRHLKLRMYHGRNSFGTVTQELVAKIRSAEKQLRSNGGNLFKMAAKEFIEELNALIDQYATHVASQVEGSIGQCEPVSRAFNSTAFALCDDIILPFNGYWLSTISSLILILPATLLAYALKGLYSLARRGSGMNHHNYSYTDQEDEVSYEEDGEEIALAYHLGHHSHLAPHKPSGSALPSAPSIADEGWSPTSASYVNNSRPPPYAV